MLPERSGPRDLRRTSGRVGPSSSSVTGLFHVEHGRCWDSFSDAQARTPTPDLRAAGEGTAVTRGSYDSPVSLYLRKSGQIVPQASGSSSLSGQGSSLSESRAPDSYNRIGITTYRVCIVPGAWMRQLLFESVSPICTLSPSIALSASRR